jgi:hypothetical protein
MLTLLAVFYVGAVCATAHAWLCIWRGRAGYGPLRDVTGIGDRTELRRLFGLTQDSGRYQVTLAAVLRHRRRSGVILSDLPVHALFLAAVAWAGVNAELPAATGIAWAAAAHALLVALAALSVFGRSRRAVAG